MNLGFCLPMLTVLETVSKILTVKAFTFGGLITMISSYQGFYTKGGALEVGTSSTRAVVYSCLAMVVADYLIAEIML